MVGEERASEQARIAAKVAQVGFVLPGSIIERFFTCTHTGCHCHAEQPVPHGPYFQRSRKVTGKTVSQTLSPDQVADYRPWVEADHRLHALVRDLEAVGLAVLAGDPRTPRRR